MQPNLEVSPTPHDLIAAPAQSVMASYGSLGSGTYHLCPGHDSILGVIDPDQVLRKECDDDHPTQQGMITDEARIRELLPLNLFAVFSERDPSVA